MISDPRSLQGILSRGANVYNGTGMNPYAGKMGKSPADLKSMIPNSQNNINYQQVAQRWLAQKSSV